MKYPNTYYASTAITAPVRAKLTQDMSIEVCIVGAGIAGLSCALELLKQGKSVAILESEAVAWGASGRNGGLVSPGWAQGNDALEAKLGLSKTKALYELSRKGGDIIKQNISQYQLQNCDVKYGGLQAGRYPQREKLLSKQRTMADKYQYDLQLLEVADVRDICRTTRYFEGLFSSEEFHFHPLNYCLGLAAQIEQLGGLIFEKSAVTKVTSDGDRHKVQTSDAQLVCDQVVFCGGGYTGEEAPALKRSFLPIATYMIVTEPLGDLAKQLISKDYSIKDDRRAADYYRLVEGDKLLWGSRITTNNQTNEQRLSKMLTEDLTSVYPELADVKIARSWSGLMAYAGHKMPIVQQQTKGQWLCSSFGGHGLNTGTICGTLVAQAICEQNDDYQQFAPFGCDWNGGVLGPIVASMTYKYLRMRDKMQER
ncbi:MAG: FAD-binding oxidoreductase [Oceanospirillaceae bacterium]